MYKFKCPHYVLSSILDSPYLLYWTSAQMVMAGNVRDVTGKLKAAKVEIVGWSPMSLISDITE